MYHVVIVAALSESEKKKMKKKEPCQAESRKVIPFSALGAKSN